MMRIGTVCSGIGAPECAWAPLGFQFVWQAEIEPFPSAVLAERFPGVPNLGDMTTIAARVLAGDVEAPDVLAGGTPCQSFSIAGLRGGISDDRGNLALEFCRLADSIDHVRRARGAAPAAIIWENVPGVLSSRDNAFGCFLAALVGEDTPILPSGGRWTNAGVVAGPARTAAWRVLDAQYFGLAQRRQRVFVVAGAGAGFDPASVLLERDGVRRDSPPRRGQGQSAAGAAAAGAGDGGGELAFGGNNRRGPIDVAPALAAHGGPCGRMDFTVEAFIASTEFLPQSSWVYSEGEVAPTLRAMSHAGSHANAGGQVAVAFHENQRSELSVNDTAGTLNLGTLETVKGWNVAASMAVRRLMPTECEALQGFPRGWTAITHRNKPAADGPRYKALGNSMAVPVLAWIGRRLLLQHAAIVQHPVALLGQCSAQVLEGLVAAEADIPAAIGPVKREALAGASGLKLQGAV